MQNESISNSRGITLGTKLVLAMIVLVVASVGTSAFYSLRTLNRLAESQANARQAEGEQALRERAEMMVRNLASSAALSISVSDIDVLHELAEKALTENPSVEWIMIIDQPSNKVLVRKPDGALGTAPKDEVYHKLQSNAKQVTESGSRSDLAFVENEADQTKWTFGGNARLRDGNLVGRVRLGMTTSEVRERIAASVASAHQEASKSARNQLLFAGIILLFGIVLAVLGSRRIAQPLQRLSLQAGYIAGGDFGQRVHVKSRDEIGQLAHSFNSMAESLGLLLHQMAHKASLERELELARDVQQTMSPPPQLLPVGNFSLTGRCEMAEQCGGDWWTYRLLSRDRLLVVVGDVTGHGVPAAMIAATARGAVEALSAVDEAIMSPARLLGAIDLAIRDVSNTNNLLMTCFAVMFDPHKGKMTFANAGHTFPYLLRPNRRSGEGELAVLAVRGNPLGDPRQCITTDERDLQPDDMLILSSDGLTDRVAQNGERFGEKRLRRILMEHHSNGTNTEVVELRDRIVNQVNDFGGQAPLDDDMTLVICQYEDPRTAKRANKIVA